MKKSPPPPSSSSSSSSCVDSDSVNLPKKRAGGKRNSKQPEKKCLNNVKQSPTKSPGRRSSIYRGVTRHRWTGRFEAHLWDKSSWNNIQNKKGRQIYLGAYDNEEAAARTYDLAALKYWGPVTALNFKIEMYENELEEMKKLSREEYLASLRRQSSGFSRGVSKFRGVARHHHNGRWEARIGRVFGNKYLYLGTYSTQEEAAVAYDMAAIEYRGASAVTNFDVSVYADRMKEKLAIKAKEKERKDGNEIPNLNEDVNEVKPEMIDEKYHRREGKKKMEVKKLFEPSSEEGSDSGDQLMIPVAIEDYASSVMAMDDCMEYDENGEHLWSRRLCLDSSLVNPSLSTVLDDIPMVDRAREISDLFNESGNLEFDDNIEDFIFDEPCDDGDENDDCLLLLNLNDDYHCDVGSGEELVEEEKVSTEIALSR